MSFGLKYSGGTQFECQPEVRIFHYIFLFHFVLYNIILYLLYYYILYVNLSAAVFIHRMYICVFCRSMQYPKGIIVGKKVQNFKMNVAVIGILNDAEEYTVVISSRLWIICIITM